MEKKIQSYVLIFGEVIYGSVDKLLQFGETVKKKFVLNTAINCGKSVQ